MKDSKGHEPSDYETSVSNTLNKEMKCEPFFGNKDGSATAKFLQYEAIMKKYGIKPSDDSSRSESESGKEAAQNQGKTKNNNQSNKNKNKKPKSSKKSNKRKNKKSKKGGK